MADVEVFRLVATDYNVAADGTPQVWLFGRDSKGRKDLFSISHVPYVYVLASKAFDPQYEVVKALDGSNVTRVDGSLPKDIPGIVKVHGGRGYEDKVLFPLRFLIDREVRSAFAFDGGVVRPATEEEAREVEGISLKTAYVDTESEVTLDSNTKKYTTIQDVQRGLALTLCVTTQFSDGTKPWTFTARDINEEKEMWRYWTELIKEEDPDVIAGWNIAGHDLRLFYERSRRVGFSPNNLSPMGYMSMREHKGRWEGNVKGLNIFEMRDFFRKYFQGRTFDYYGLEYIASRKELFGDRAIPESEYDYENKMNVGYLDEVVKYNQLDVERLVMIDDVLGLVNQFDGIQKIAGCLLTDTIDTSRYADALFLREFRGKYVLGTKEWQKRKKFEGAKVLVPTVGVYEHIAMVDFAGMYPTIIISYNISPEMMVDEATYNENPELYHNIDGVYFKKKPLGIVPKAIIRFVEHRKKVKAEMKKYDRESMEYKVLDNKQYAIKQMIAAMYGFFAYPYGRMYYPELSASITYCGRKNILSCVEFITGLGYKVRYGDTDSLLIQVSNDVKKDGEDLEEKLNEFLVELAEREGLHEPPIIEFETGYRRLLLGKKKRYAGLCTYYKGRDSNFVIIKGFEAKRSDSAIHSRDLQTEVVTRILNGEEEAKTCRYIKELWNEFDPEKLHWKDIGIPDKLSRPPHLYPWGGAGKIHVLFANEHMGKNYGEGDRPFKFWIRRVLEGYPAKMYINGKWRKVNRVAINSKKEYEQWKPVIDWDMQKHKIIERKLELILSAWGKTLGQILAGHTQSKLF